MKHPARSPAPFLVITAEDRILDRVLTVCAGAGAEPVVQPDPGAARADWSGAAAVLVGVDQAERLAATVLPRRVGVFVVGEAGDAERVLAWSGRLGAAVALLPDGSNSLLTAMVEAREGVGGALVLAVVPGSGGAGASTLAAGVAAAGGRRGWRTLLVDLDPRGGGLDLLLGLEHAAGWRWPRLATADGHLGSLSGHLPALDGVDVLSMARADDGPDGGASATSVTAVLLSARRSYELVVVDAPRTLTEPVRGALRQATTTVVVVTADVRGVAAARRTQRELAPACRDLAVVVRIGPRSLVDARSVAAGLGLPLALRCPDDPATAAAVQRGEPPGRSGRSALARSCDELVAALAAGREVAA